MRNWRRSSLLLILLFLLLALLASLMTAFLPKEKTTDTLEAAKVNAELADLRMSAEAETRPAGDAEGVPYLYLWVWQEAAEDPEKTAKEEQASSIPAWLETGTEETQTGSYALLYAYEDEDEQIFEIALREISRKGRLHRNKQSLLGMTESADWQLWQSSRLSEKKPMSDGGEESTSILVHVVMNGEDRGLGLLSPVIREKEAS